MISAAIAILTRSKICVCGSDDRTVLEILRNNSKLEALYAMTAHRAFQFCKQYKRTTEFRRLCEIIRNHLANLNKYRDQRDRPDLSAPESLQLYLDTRFEQLKIATELELWQEAFRSVEDIHGLMCMVKKTPKPSLMVVYYAKLTEIFWISASHLNHAYAWFKLFSLQKSFNKNLSQKDLQLIASSVVSKGVLSCATQEVKDLFHLLEHEFLPLDLAVKIQPLLTKISKFGGKLASASSVPEVQLSQYVPALEKLGTLRLLQQAFIHPTVDVAEIIRRWTHALQRIHKQSLHMAKANEGEGPEILRSAHEGSSSGHAESLAATLAEHQQHLVSFQVLINQLKEVAPAIQKSILECTDKVDSISSNLPPMTKHPGQMEKVTIKAL
ncbi:hypothetical protein RchiOBHm_Chr6g0248701 [Rosa chinensis]|uniref:eIF3a PCI domain-containing protein n=1 Tax=Rosa chinensis TaxID=74649 RepID=A0A2P6PK42_ROSCH|nr:hypothetical protein RchiOBHm_Chr6g0248701 [Rosa chinensis]